MAIRHGGARCEMGARVMRAGHLGSAALGLALLTSLATGAQVAEAHNAVVSTSPTDGATVETVPGRVVMTFNEPAKAVGTVVRVTGPNGEVQQGPVTLVDDTVSQTIGAGAPAGAYRVEWRVVSADGHPITGASTFTAKRAGGSPSATAPPTTSATPTPATGSAPDVAAGSHSALWPALAGAATAIVLVVVGCVLTARRRR